MLTVNNLSKSFGIDPILKGISFSLNSGDRLGLVGPNGSGKTTLLCILAGEDRPDSGGISFDPPFLRVGYMPQGFVVPQEIGADNGQLTALTIGRYLDYMEGDFSKVSAHLESLASALAQNPDRRELQNEYDATLARLAAIAESSGRGPAVVAALGLSHLALDMPILNLSGGQKTRLALAGVLLSSPQLLLLDEPTNHLDLDMLTWLEDWLAGFSGAALIVSHDRAFLDRTATAILELDPQTHASKAYPGNYTAYLEQKIGVQTRQWQEYVGQQEEIGHLQASAARLRGVAKFRKGGKGDSGDKFAKGFFGNRSAGTIRRAKQLEKRLERLLTDERVEKPKQGWQMKLNFDDSRLQMPEGGRDVVTLEELSAGYGANALLQDLNLQIRQEARVALVGPNGSGKTTLLRTISGTLPPVSGKVRIGANIRMGYMAQEQEDLDLTLDAYTTIRNLAPFSETDARAFLHRFLFSGDDVFLPVGNLSFGERARLSLACLVAQGCNLLLLDESINHLDIPSRARFEQALAGYDGTVLAVVHDRYFIEGFATEIWEVEGLGLRKTELVM